MNYLLSSFDCLLWGDKNYEIKAGVKYKLLDTSQPALIFHNNDSFILSTHFSNEQILKVDILNNTYFLIVNQKCKSCSVAQFKFKNKEVFVSVLDELNICYDGLLICEKNVDNIKFSHFEVFGDFLFIYFQGKRDFVVVMKEELCFADFYDEYNHNVDEKIFMCKLNDCLNHGKVYEITKENFSSYLVYLDENDMELKEDFVANVFLDCVLAKNISYCKHLMLEDFVDSEVFEFFPEFDNYFNVEKNIFILTKKNTLAGIFEFEIENCRISNIIPLQPQNC